MTDANEKVLSNAFEIYKPLRIWLWNALTNPSVKAEDFLQDAVLGFEAMTSVPPNTKLAAEWAKIVEIPFKHKDYGDLIALRGPTFSETTGSGKYDLSTASFVIALGALKDETEAMYNAIKEGKNTQIIEIQPGEGNPVITRLFLLDGITNPLVDANKAELEHIIDTNFEILMETFHARQEDETVSMPVFIEVEFAEFQRLFTSTGDDCTYLSRKLGTDHAHIRKLKELSYDVIHGKYVSTYFSFDTEEHLDYGWLLAARKYLDFLRSPLSRITNPGKPLPDSDDRIPLDERQKKFMESCFSSFLLEKHFMADDATPIKREDLDYFLQANFTGFGDKVQRKKFKVPFRNTTHFVAYVKQILVTLYKGKQTSHDYHSYKTLITKNFEGFESLKEKTMTDYFSKQIKDMSKPLYALIEKASTLHLK